MEIGQKLRNGLLLFDQEQKAIVFPIIFLLFCDQKFRNRVSKCIFFPEWVVETLKKWAPPVKLHSSAPRGVWDEVFPLVIRIPDVGIF